MRFSVHSAYTIPIQQTLPFNAKEARQKNKLIKHMARATGAQVVERSSSHWKETCEGKDWREVHIYTSDKVFKTNMETTRKVLSRLKMSFLLIRHILCATYHLTV